MAAYSDIIATVGGSTSNSYVTGAEADSYAEFQSWNDAWLGKAESERTIALINACRWLDTVDFAGTRCNPSSDDGDLPQALSWPRSDVSCDGVAATCSYIPREIKEAQILIAYNLVINPELITGTPGGGGSAPSGTYVKRNKSAIWSRSLLNSRTTPLRQPVNAWTAQRPQSLLHCRG